MTKAKEEIIQIAGPMWEYLTNAKKRHIFSYGGAGSAKSWQMAIYLCTQKAMLQPGVGILVVRKTGPAVRASCYVLIKSILNKLNVKYTENKTEMVITLKATGAWFKFTGLDDVEKVKSIEGINYIWVEETTEIKNSDYWQLNLRCRAHNNYGINHIYSSFNPTDPESNLWLKKITDKAPDNADVGKFTYLDNPFLSAEEVAVIEDLVNVDAQFDKIYRLGEWATPTEIIYNNWDIVKRIPSEMNIVYFGTDFGYTNPAAVIKITTNDEAKDVYVEEIVYETRLTNPQLIDRAGQNGLNKTDPDIADSAEPDRIAEFRQAGYNVYPAYKGPGSVNEGIDRVRCKRLHILESAANIQSELRGYKNKVNKDGDVLEDPVPFKDHAMDALRYAIKRMDTDLNIPLGIVYAEDEPEDDEMSFDELIMNEDIWD